MIKILLVQEQCPSIQVTKGENVTIAALRERYARKLVSSFTGGLMQEALRPSRTQYANIEEPKTAQSILNHPKLPTA